MIEDYILLEKIDISDNILDYIDKIGEDNGNIKDNN